MDNVFELIPVHPFEDRRGSLKKIMMKSNTDINIEEIYLLYSNTGSIRGNHYHKNTVEYFAIISGTAKVGLRSINIGDITELTISSDDNMVLKVPVNTIHAFKNENEQPLIILAVSSREYNELDSDTFIKNILV